MKPTLDNLNKENLISPEYYTNSIEELQEIDSIHEKIIERLVNSQNRRKSIYKEVVTSEVLMISKIEDVLESDVFKKLYLIDENKEKVNKLLSPFTIQSLKQCESYTALKKIYEELVNIIDDYISYEKQKLTNVKEEIGNKLWDDFGDYFKNELLEIILK